MWREKEFAVQGVQGSIPHRTEFFNMHKVEYRHPERSEGSLHRYTEVIIVLQYLQYKDSSQLVAQKDRMIVCRRYVPT